MLTIDYQSDQWVVKRDGVALGSFSNLSDTESFLDELERSRGAKKQSEDLPPDSGDDALAFPVKRSPNLVSLVTR